MQATQDACGSHDPQQGNLDAWPVCPANLNSRPQVSMLLRASPTLGLVSGNLAMNQDRKSSVACKLTRATARVSWASSYASCRGFHLTAQWHQLASLRRLYAAASSTQQPPPSSAGLQPRLGDGLCLGLSGTFLLLLLTLLVSSAAVWDDCTAFSAA